MFARISCFLPTTPAERESIISKLIRTHDDITEATASDLSQTATHDTVVCLIHPNGTRMLLGPELDRLEADVKKTIEATLLPRRHPPTVLVQRNEKPASSDRVQHISA